MPKNKFQVGDTVEVTVESAWIFEVGTIREITRGSNHVQFPGHHWTQTVPFADSELRLSQQKLDFGKEEE